MNYIDLREDLKLWTANSNPEFLVSINRFIRLAESKIATLVQIPDYTGTGQVTATAKTQTTDTSTIGLIISVDYIVFNGYGMLEKKDESFIREAYPDASEYGPPRYYALRDSHTLRWGPTPDLNYTGDIQFFAKWPSLVDLGKNTKTQDEETYISSVFETTLLSASLYYAALWRGDIAAAQVFNQEMIASLGPVEKLANGSIKRQTAEKGNAAID